MRRRPAPLILKPLQVVHPAVEDGVDPVRLLVRPVEPAEEVTEKLLEPPGARVVRIVRPGVGRLVLRVVARQRRTSTISWKSIPTVPAVLFRKRT